MNQNNFQTQGNNGIPNNQNLNPIPTSNQPIVNSQPQPMNQPIVENHPIELEYPKQNTDKEVNIQPKKPKIGITIGIALVSTITVVGIVFGLKYLKNANKSNSNSITNSPVVDVNYMDAIQEGTIELTKTSQYPIENYSEDIIFFENYEFFETTNKNNETIIIDNKGKQIAPLPDKKKYQYSEYKYLGDGYFIYKTETKDEKKIPLVVKNGELVVSLDSYYNEFGDGEIIIKNCAYRNGILYFSLEYSDITIAYDLKNKKELWRATGVLLSGYVLDDNFIRLETNENPNADNSFVSTPRPNTIIDFNGNKIISGADLPSVEQFGRKKYESRIYTSKANTYLEVKQNDYIKVYDFNKNLKATIDMKSNDKDMIFFRKVLYSGVFIVEKCLTGNGCQEILYDANGKEILKASSIDAESYLSGTSDEYILPKNIELFEINNYVNEKLTTECVLIKDGEVFGKYKSCAKAVHNYGLIHDYLLYYEQSSDNSETSNGETTHIVNVNNMKSITLPNEYSRDTKIYSQSPFGSYVVLKTDKAYYVYDSEMNLKYENTYGITPINEKYVMSTKKIGEGENENYKKILINIETGKITELNLKGNYYSRNATGIVTYDGTNYYLYRFK